MSNAWEVDWRKRTKARGVDPDQILRKLQGANTPSAAPMPSAGGARPRAGEPAVRPDRASREGVLSTQASLMTTLARINRSELKDKEKQKLYDVAGASQSMVDAAVRAISEDGEVRDVQAVADTLPTKMSDRLVERAGGSTDPQFAAAIRRLREQERLAAKRQPDPAQVAAQLEGQLQQMTRDEPWWMDVLLKFDKPRAAVVAGFSQLGAVIDDHLGYDPTGRNSVASWERFWDQYNNQVTASSLMDKNMNPWVRGIIGFGVDVLLDPITYATGGSGAVAKVLGKGGVKAAQIAISASDKASDAAKAAQLAGKTDDAARLAREAAEYDGVAKALGTRGGYGGTNKAERAVLERAAKYTDVISDAQTLRGGVYFRLPGTEGVRIPVVSELLQPVGMYTTRGLKRAATSKALSPIFHPFSTRKRVFLRNFRSLDGKAQTDALKSLREVTLGEVNGMQFAERTRSLVTNLQLQARQLGVDLEDGSLRRLMDAPGADPTNPLAVRVAAEGGDGPVTKLVNDYADWHEYARTFANEIVGDPNWLQKVDNYVYHRLNVLDEMADSIARSEGREAFGLSGPEMQRAIQQDRIYRGVRIVEPQEAVALYGRAMSPEDQALEIMRRQGVPLSELGLTDDATGLFVDDMVQLSESYIRTIQARIVEKSIEQGLLSGAVAMTTRRFNLLKQGGALTAKERLLQRARFTGRVDQVAKARVAAAAAGRPLPSMAGVDLAQTVASLGAVRTGALTPEQFAQQVDSVAGMIGREADRIDGLLGEIDELWKVFSRESERIFQAGNAGEAFDLTVVGVSDSAVMQRIYARMAGFEDEITALASGFVGASGNDIARARGLLDEQLKSMVDELQMWREYADGLRSFRELPEQMRGLDVAVEIQKLEKQLEQTNSLFQVFNRVDDAAMRLTRFASAQDDNVVAVRRALEPGSDGIARLSNGEVARFTRVVSDAGNFSAFDGVGVRFPLADDMDAADARMFGDMAGLGDDVRIRAGQPIEDVSPRIQGLSRQVDAIDMQIRRVEDEIADPSPNFFAETKLSPATNVSPEMDLLARQMWDDPNFNAVSREFFGQYEDLVSLKASINEIENPSLERLRVLGRERLEKYRDELFEIESEMERFGAGRNRKGQLRWFVDVGMKGFRRKNAKGGYGKGRIRGGEYDWFDSLSKSQQNFLSRNYFESSSAGRSATNRKGSGINSPDGNVLSFNRGSVGELKNAGEMELEEYWENVLRLIGEHASIKDGIAKLNVAVRKPRNADLVEDRLDDLRNMLVDEADGDYQYYKAMVEQIPYTEKQFREVYTRINELGGDRIIGKANLNPVYKGLQEARQRAADQLLTAQRQAKRERLGAGLFNFETTVSRPLTLTGANAEAQMLADMLVTSVKNKLIPMGSGPITTTDQALWNQVSQLVNVAARRKTMSPADLDVLVQHTNRLIGSYARLDDTSAAARLVAASDNPAAQMFDEIVNVGSLTANQRFALGDWDAMLTPMRHSPDQVASGYRKRLAASGFDGVMLDDGSLRQLVSLTPQSMRPTNAASKVVLQILNQQHKMLSQLGKLQSSKVKLVDQWGVNPELATAAADAAAATQRANSKRVGKLARRQRSGKPFSKTDEDELLFRRSADDLFRLADDAEAKAQKLLDDDYARHLQDTAVAARTEGLVPADYRLAPELGELAARLRSEAGNMRLIGQADAADADALVAGFGRGYEQLFMGDLAEKAGLADELSALLTRGLSQFSAGSMAPDDIVANLKNMAQIVQPAEVRKFLRGWDYLTGLFKTYAVATLGFINRNLLGGVMNNWVGFVNLKSYGEFMKANKAFSDAVKRGDGWQAGFAAVGKKYGAAGEQAFRTWVEVAPALAGGQAAAFAGDVGLSGGKATVGGSGIGRAMAGKGLLDQGIVDNAATRGFFYANTRSEYFLRGPVVWDELIRKGGDKVSAVDRVYTLHFDYSAAGMSNFERGTLKRIVPFYVWMANNIPLQLKALVTRPKVAASYIKFKQNFESLSEDEAVVAEYFGRLGAIRLPFTNKGLGQYLMPDLPFRDLGIIKGLPAFEGKSLNPLDALGQTVDWDELLASISPLARVPVETLLLERKVFTGQPFRDSFVEMPRSFTMVPVVPQALQFMNLAARDSDGKWWVNERASYSVESNLPLVNRINRLFPSTETGKEKQLAVWLSTFLGLGFRTNTPREQSNELFRLQEKLDKEIRAMQTLGVNIPTAGELKRSDKEQATIASWQQTPVEASYMLNVLNSGNVDAIKDLNGFGDVSAAEMAANVQTYGGFADLQDLGTARGVPQSAVTKALEALGERRSASLDFATADIDDLIAMPGIGPKTAPKIQAYARRNGGIGNLGELRQFGLSNKQIQALDIWLREEREFQRMLAGVR